MPIYNHDKIRELRNVVRGTAERFFEHTALIADENEFLDACIKPEHMLMLRQVQDLCKPATPWRVATRRRASDGEIYNVVAHFRGHAPIIIPHYVADGLLDDERAEPFMEKLTPWFEERVRLGRAFGDACDALFLLDEICESEASMAVLFPCLPTLLMLSDTSAKKTQTRRAKQLLGRKRPAPLPRLPRDVTNRVAEVSALVSSVATLGPAPCADFVSGTVKLVLAGSTSSSPSPIFECGRPEFSGKMRTFV